MALYECVLIARQDISSAQVEQLAEQFTGILRENGGEVKKTEFWGLKTLTYKVKKNRKGHYVLFNLDAPHVAVAEMERNLSLHEDVLRHMVVRVETLQEGPSAVLQNRGERDRDRGDRRGRFEGGGGGGGGRFDSGRPPRGPAPMPGNEGEAA